MQAIGPFSVDTLASFFLTFTSSQYPSELEKNCT